MTRIVRRFVVREYERGLLFRNGELEVVLGPGTHWRLDPLQRLEVAVVDLSVPAFRHRLQDFLVKSWPRNVRERFEVVETGPDQAAAIYLNGQLQEVIGPSQRAVYRKGVAEVAATVIGIRESFRVERSIARVLVARASDWLAAVAKIVVQAGDAPEGKWAERREC